LPCFSLAHPPEENALPPDQRTIGSKDSPILSPKTILVIRKARRAQKLAGELEEDLGVAPVYLIQSSP
jgi:hypothetical protein